MRFMLTWLAISSLRNSWPYLLGFKVPREGMTKNILIQAKRGSILKLEFQDGA